MIDSDTESHKLRLDDEHPEKYNQLKTKRNWRNEVKKRIYILTWLPTYDKSAAISDMIAGTTVGVTMIAQAIAYASLAELPSQYGLYSAFVGNYLRNSFWFIDMFYNKSNNALFFFTGSLVYVFFGTIKEVSIGPTSLMSILTLQYTIGKPPEYAVLLSFLVGVVELLMGILQLSEYFDLKFFIEIGFF